MKILITLNEKHQKYLNNCKFSLERLLLNTITLYGIETTTEGVYVYTDDSYENIKANSAVSYEK